MLVYQGSGVATYTYNLVKSLLTYYPEHEYRLFYSSLRRPKDFEALSSLEALGAKVYSLRLPTRLLRIIWNRLEILPVEYLIGKVDVFFTSDYLRPPLLPGTRCITTIHDLTWRLYPDLHTSSVIADHTRKLERTLTHHDTIIVDSESTKRDLVRLYPKVSANNQVFVIYPGVSDTFPQAKFSPKTSQKNYLVYVGAIEPRKNIDKAIRIFAELIKIKKYADFEFLIGGRAGWKNEHIYKLVTELKLEGKVVFLGYVKDSDLPELYHNAKACMYLSEYEGFGLPPLEAAASGTPTLLYNNSSLGELFPNTYPYAKEGSELKTLISLIETGHSLPLSKYAQKFSWKLFAQEFVRIAEYAKN